MEQQIAARNAIIFENDILSNKKHVFKVKTTIRLKID